jgi:hypothetical protein
MRKIFSSRTLLSLLLGLIVSTTSFAWERSIEAGYGYSHDPNDTKHYNSGIFLSGDLWPLWFTPYTFWTLNGALGHWYSTAPNNKYVTTVAAALALRYYPWTYHTTYPFYLTASAGPAYLSAKQFGVNKQGSNLAFQTFLGLGTEFYQHYDVNLRFVHYSNAYTSRPNNGYNILYVLSFGYLF